MNAPAGGWGRPGHPTGGLSTVILKSGLRVRVATKIAPLVKYLGDETERRGYDLRPADTGGYNFRAMRGSSSTSFHSWGLAVDLNWQTNPMTRRGGPVRTDMPRWLITLWEDHGFRWGGRWNDAMHFEFRGSPGEADRFARILGQHPIAPNRSPAVEAALVFDPAKCAFSLWPLSTSKPTLRVGSSGDAVRYAQAVMRCKGSGHHDIPIDGDFGQLTKSTVEAYQRWAGFPANYVDGVVGWSTRRPRWSTWHLLDWLSSK